MLLKYDFTFILNDIVSPYCILVQVKRNERKLTLSTLQPTKEAFAKSADPDQLASEEAV